jgi:hypothetical protein
MTYQVSERRVSMLLPLARASLLAAHTDHA